MMSKKGRVSGLFYVCISEIRKTEKAGNTRLFCSRKGSVS